MITPYNINEALEAEATTPEELRRRQRLIEEYGGGIEVVDPDSPLSASEFAEAAMYVFEEYHWDSLIDELDNVLNSVAGDLPQINSLMIAFQYNNTLNWLSILGSESAYDQATSNYYYRYDEARPVHLIDIREKIERYDEGIFGGLLGMLGFEEKNRPDNIYKANREITELFAWELARSVFEYYVADRGFEAKLTDQDTILQNIHRDDNGNYACWPFCVGVILYW